MNNNNEKLEKTGDQSEIIRRKKRERKKPYRSKLSSEKKAELNKKNRERYYREKCVNSYALKHGMSVNQINILLKNGELIYSKDNNELLMNHLSRTINVEMPIETYNKYKIWMQNGCPIASDTGDQNQHCEVNTLSDDIKEAKMLLSNDNNNPDDIQDDNVARGGSGLSVNSSDDDDNEMCHISKPMKGNVIEDNNEHNEGALHERNGNGKSTTNAVNESIVHKFIPVIITKEVYDTLPKVIWKTYTTIPIGEKVMKTEYNDIYEPVIYVCDVKQIKIYGKMM